MRKLVEKREKDLFFKSLESRFPGENLELLTSVRAITAKVKNEGRVGLLELRQEFEKVAVDEKLTFALSDMHEKAKGCPQDVLEAVHLSIGRVRNYHSIQVEKTKILKDGKSFLGSRVQPLDSVALYVPGGKAFYPSSMVMTVVPAQVAGVKRLAVFTPFRSLDNPVFAATVIALGIDEVHAVGGAQAVAMAAYGIYGVERCDKIVGPGNSYVATAKQLLSGRIGVDSFAGPSEILILADGTSPASWIAADLLAQAEHDIEASAILATTSEKQADEVLQEIQIALKKLGDRESIARESLKRLGAVFVVKTREELLNLANSISPEHLHLHTECALTPEGQKYWQENLKGVGAIFFGKYTAESFGDYVAGPSHVLPTAGTSRFASPLGVYDFLRRSSLIYLDESDVQSLIAPTVEFANAEKLWGHAHAAQLRRESNS